MKHPSRCPSCARSGRVASIQYGEPMAHGQSAQALIVDGGCCLRGDGLDPVWHCISCEHEWGWSEVRPGSQRMTAEELAAALVASPGSLESIMSKRAMTTQELADAAGWGLRRTADLIQALQLAGALVEEKDASLPSGVRGGDVPRLFRLKLKTSRADLP